MLPAHSCAFWSPTGKQTPDDCIPVCGFYFPATNEFLQLPLGTFHPPPTCPNCDYSLAPGRHPQVGLEADLAGPPDLGADAMSDCKTLPQAVDVVFQAYKGRAYFLLIKDVFPVIDIRIAVDTGIEMLYDTTGMISLHGSWHARLFRLPEDWSNFPDPNSSAFQTAFQNELKGYLASTRSNLLRYVASLFIYSTSNMPNCGFVVGDSPSRRLFNGERADRILNQVDYLDEGVSSPSYCK
jgi:hypothetical protein